MQPFVTLTGDFTYDWFVTLAVWNVIICTIWENVNSSPYGKFGGGIVVNPRLGWWLMEIPCTVAFLSNFHGSQSGKTVPMLLGGLFCMHYAYRGWIFPFLIRPHKDSKGFSLIPAIFGAMVTVPHGYLSARWYAEFGTHLDENWLSDPRFLIGISIYLVGFVGILYHDYLLRILRQPNGEGPRYQIPVGGLFECASSAQYFCELVAWFGFMLMGWGPNGWHIFLVSMGNLTVRAHRTHLWFQEKFDDYPPERKRLVPYLW